MSLRNPDVQFSKDFEGVIIHGHEPKETNFNDFLKFHQMGNSNKEKLFFEKHTNGNYGFEKYNTWNENFTLGLNRCDLAEELINDLEDRAIKFAHSEKKE